MAETPKTVAVKVKLELSLTDHTVRVLDALTDNKGVLLPTINQLMAEAWAEGIEAGVDGSVPECDYARNPYLKGATS